MIKEIVITFIKNKIFENEFKNVLGRCGERFFLAVNFNILTFSILYDKMFIKITFRSHFEYILLD